MRSPDTEAKPTFLDHLANFLTKYRVLLLGLLIGLTVLVAGYFVYSEVHKQARERSALMAERAQDLYQEWESLQEQTARKAKEQELREQIDRILDKYPRQYAAQRALYLKASLAYGNRMWQEAAESYETLARSFPKSYLAEISLAAAAVSHEQAGDVQAAIAACERFSARYAESFARPHVLFALGRLYEQQEDFAAAVRTYNSLEEEFPFSDWTKAGRNRIIALKIDGKTAE